MIHPCLSCTGNPKLNTECQVYPHQCQVQWKDHSLSSFTLLYQREPISYLGHKDTLLVHVQFNVYQVLFRQGAFQLHGPHHILVDWFVLPQVHNFALVERHEISVSPFLLAINGKILEMVIFSCCLNSFKTMLRCSLFPGSLPLLTQEARWEHYISLKFTLQKDHRDTPLSQVSTLKQQDCFSWWQCWLSTCETMTQDDAKTS